MISFTKPPPSAVLNKPTDLDQFADEAFDVVAIHIFFQRIFPQFVPGRMREFGCICRSEGAVAFQLPMRYLRLARMSLVKCWIVEHLSFGLGDAHRRWKQGTAARFDIYVTPQETAKDAAIADGLVFRCQEPDGSAG